MQREDLINHLIIASEAIIMGGVGVYLSMQFYEDDPFIEALYLCIANT